METQRPSQIGPPPGGRRPGRPRRAATDESILAATIEILAERGVHGLSVDDVAARAHAGKDTIYRRWPTRAQLVGDALARSAAIGVPIIDTGNIEDDLVTYLHEVARFLSDTPFGRIAASVIGAAIDDPALLGAAKAFWSGRRAMAGSILQRAIERGELPPHSPVDLLVDFLVGPIYYRWLVIREPTDLVQIRETVRRILNGERSARGRAFPGRS